jgi:hypothetical protein
MSSDDLTRKQGNADDDIKETQPTITAVFRLIQDVESRFNARLDEFEARFTARLDEVETRLNARFEGVTRDIAELNKRVTEGFKDLGHKMNALNRRALQTEADNEDLSERIGRLESKAS